MAERRQEILDLARQRPIPPGRGLPTYQEPGSKNTGPLTVYVFNRTGIVSVPGRSPTGQPDSRLKQFMPKIETKQRY
jgi:hypothetical protein